MVIFRAGLVTTHAIELSHIPPHPKNGFWGVMGVGGSFFGVILHIFCVFLQKTLYRFMKEVEIEYSVLEDS